MIAALYVETDGCYFGLPDVDPWDEERDARLYDGPWPVVAHPPCERWGKYWFGSPFAVSRGEPRKVLGDDDGCFAAALAAVRRWGGVLEHPERSKAWREHGLAEPQSGAWQAADFEGGWTCQIHQGSYGHRISKPTWLYACGVDLPSLNWRPAQTGFMESFENRPYAKRSGELSFLGRSERKATPTAFRDLLLSIARTANRAEVA